MSLLQINNLSVRFGDANAVPVVDGLDLAVDAGEILAIVGESGSGKSVTMMALMGLIEPPGRITADTLTFDGTNMLKLSPRQRRKVVGKDIAMVFQDPMTALNPATPWVTRSRKCCASTWVSKAKPRASVPWSC